MNTNEISKPNETTDVLGLMYSLLSTFMYIYDRYMEIYQQLSFMTNAIVNNNHLEYPRRQEIRINIPTNRIYPILKNEFQDFHSIGLAREPPEGAPARRPPTTAWQAASPHFTPISPPIALMKHVIRL